MKVKTQENYGGLDLFRVAAALLVIAIHTSPLASFHESADFFLTRVLARIAVPFFFMVTGHFILRDLFSPQNQLRKYLYRLCLLYGFSVLLYIPLGLYAGHYDNLTFGGFLRMLLFDGTFYHLWYFPACILGMLLVILLSQFIHLKGITAISVFLYLIGLFGDSYYGIAAQIPVLKTCYDAMFHIFSYTRNGLFFAPLFLVLGIWAGQSNHLIPSSRTFTPSVLRFIFFFCAMTVEAFTLRHFGLQRHDSMYLFLVPVMFCLYRCLLSVPKASKKTLRTTATWIYLLHPAFIVVIRGVAKLFHLTGLLVDNSLIHFFAVSFLSVLSGIIMTCLTSRFRKRLRSTALLTAKTLRNKTLPIRPGTERAWIELDLGALKHNVHFLQSRLPKDCRLMPAVKADAYGHGAVIISRTLNHLGIQDFCVACVSEGIQLRKAGIKGQILILGYTPPWQFSLLRRYRLTQTVVDDAYAEELRLSGVKVHVHIAVDTGMHRLGICHETPEQIAAVYEMKNLTVDGIYTHLSACDCTTPQCRAFTESQISAFYRVTDYLKSNGYPCRELHLLSSYGILNYPEACADLVRPGIALYGVLSSKGDPMSDLLQPVLSVKARVASVRTLQPGEAAGYGMGYTAKQKTRIAVLAIGYADGVPRELSSCGGYVLIHGMTAPVIGRICMDQMLLDVSTIADVTPGDIAVIIGTSDSREIKAEEIAEQCNTITNEILSRLGARLHRIPVNRIFRSRSALRQPSYSDLPHSPKK